MGLCGRRDEVGFKQRKLVKNNNTTPPHTHTHTQDTKIQPQKASSPSSNVVSCNWTLTPCTAFSYIPCTDIVYTVPGSSPDMLKLDVFADNV